MKKDNSKKIVVKYNNDLNDIQYGVFSAKELDLLFTVLNEIREELPMDDGEAKSFSYIEREYPLSRIREIMGLPTIACSNGRLRDRILTLGDKLTRIRCFFDAPGLGKGYMCLCPLFTVGEDGGTLLVHFNRTYLYLLSRVDMGYTSFELSEYLSLNHIASKVLYHKVKQYKMAGEVFYPDIDYFRQQMVLPETARARQIVSRIIEPAVEELKAVVPGLKLEVEKVGSRHEIKGFSLLFTPAKAKPEYLNKKND